MRTSKDNFTPTRLQEVIARENGLTRRTVCHRVNNLGWDVQRAITQPLGVGRNYSGVFTPEDIRTAEKNGISQTCLSKRVLKLGWSIEDAKTVPVGSRPPGRKPGKSYSTEITDEDIRIANKNGITKNCLTKRVRLLGWSIEDARTLPVYSRRKCRRTKSEEGSDFSRYYTKLD